MANREMVNFQKLDFLRFLTTNSVTTGARELDGPSVISLATHNSKREMLEILMRFRQVLREWYLHEWINFIWESPPQFENQIMARVHVRSIMRSTMYLKAPFCSP